MAKLLWNFPLKASSPLADQRRGFGEDIERYVVAVRGALHEREPVQRHRPQLGVRFGEAAERLLQHHARLVERALAPVADGEFGLRLDNFFPFTEPLEKRGAPADEILRGLLRPVNRSGTAYLARQPPDLQQNLRRLAWPQPFHRRALADAPPQPAQGRARPLEIARLLVGQRHLATELRTAVHMKV
ncbi:MAG: hypothetical protein M3348_17695 [Acidobacteriota bacterium]|nr:hypothetical protein [Acidobacteriota bacterium]